MSFNKFSEFEEQEISLKYLNGESSVVLSKIYNVSYSTILRIIRRNNINVRTQPEAQRKYNCDYNFFEDINTEEKAYWLGFIAADGCVNVRKNQSVLTISLQGKDENHLEKFKKNINSTHPIRKYKVNKYNVCSISISNKKLVNDLNKYGIIQNKSLILEFPIIKKEFLNHFLRGYIDGDGGFYPYKKFNKKRNNYYNEYEFSVTSSKNFLEDFQKILIENCSLNETKLKKAGNAFTLRYSGHNQVDRIFNFIYSNCLVYLDRKYIKYIASFADHQSPLIYNV